MVGLRGVNRWWAVGMSALMALSLAAVTGGVAMAQDESAAPAEARRAGRAGWAAAGLDGTARPQAQGRPGHEVAGQRVLPADAEGAEEYAAENAERLRLPGGGHEGRARLRGAGQRRGELHHAAVRRHRHRAGRLQGHGGADRTGPGGGHQGRQHRRAARPAGDGRRGIDLAFFGPDNRAGAKLAGDSLGQALGEGGKVVILEGNPEADNAVQRKARLRRLRRRVRAGAARLPHGALGDRGGRGDDLQLPHASTPTCRASWPPTTRWRWVPSRRSTRPARPARSRSSASTTSRACASTSRTA